MTLAFWIAAIAVFAVTALGEVGRWFVVADVVNHGRIVTILVAVAAIGFAALVRAPRVVLAVLGAALLWQCANVVPEFWRAAGASTAAPANRALVVVTYNTRGLKTDGDALAAWVEAEGIDVLLLQGVTSEALEVRQPLSAVLPHAVARRWQANLVLSRHPLEEWPLDRLPPRANRSWYFPVVTVLPRGMAPFEIVSVHTARPPPLARGQGSQLAWLSETARRVGRDRLIVAGDFNLTPFSHRFGGFEAALGLGRATNGLPTFPSQTFGALLPFPPFLPIDHVFHGRAFEPVSVGLGPNLGSDHFPVIARLVERR